MPLSAGTRLGPYEVVSAIGAGGMGEVYRARDSRLGRDVALKILPASFAGDSDRRARFEREAQAIAALSHPNIVAVYDTGVHEGQIYLVMELLDGETLRDRLRAGALPVRKAVDAGVQIARGLAAAHAKGLVHRDLKPENLFILADGQVKILDFGLARVLSTGSGATETVPVVTDPGTVMGTVGYMAPEQVRGQTVDARADLFALGAVLYEMFSGQRAFRRDTPAETMAAILNEDPLEASTLPSGLSPALDQILRHCLEKNPNERFQSARDVAFALEAFSGSGAIRTAEPSKRRRAWSPIAATAAAAVVLSGALGLWVGRRMAPSDDVRYSVKTSDRQTIYNARFLPDGAMAYSAAHVGMIPELFLLQPNRVAPERLLGPGTHLLSVSSNGELAILTNARLIEHRLFTGTLARLTLGASPRPWLDSVREADWSPDGTTLAVITRVPGSGGDRLEYPTGTLLYEVSGYLSDVRVSHDGRRVAFVEHRGTWDDRGWIKVVGADKQVLTLTEEYSAVEGLAWSPRDDQVLYSATAASGPGLQPYVVSSAGGRPARIALRLPGDAIVHDVDLDGRWLVTREDQRWDIVIRSPGDATEHEMPYLSFSKSGELSTDGTRLFFTSQNVGEGLDYAVMLRQTDGSPPVRLGEGEKLPRGLSPDGRWVAAYVTSTSRLVFYPVGAGAPRQIALSPDSDFGGWFSDSQHVMIMTSLNGAPARCYRQAIAGGAPEPMGPADADFCMALPDGGLLAHTRAGTMQLFERPDATPLPVGDFDGTPVAFEPGGFAIFGTPAADQSFRVERLNLRTGERTVVATVAAVDRAGLVKQTLTSVVGKPGRYGYAYGLARDLSTLFLVSGASTNRR